MSNRFEAEESRYDIDLAAWRIHVLALLLKHVDRMRTEPNAPQISKTQRKKEMHALQALCEQLVELTPEQLDELALPERLADAILEAKRITGFEARRRQMQFIGRLMRAVDAAPIAARIAAFKDPARRDNVLHHAVEQWRERLLADESALTELARDHGPIDTQQLRTLIRNARKEQARSAPPHAARALFRALKSVLAGPRSSSATTMTE